MVQGPSLDAIEAIRNPASLDGQIESLKQLKNDIVGHDQRKELVVKQGIVEPLVSIISTPSKVTGKRRIAETNGASIPNTRHHWSQEEEARLQATLILASLAGGGVAFVAPLLAADTSKHLLDALEAESSPSLITAILQALRNLAASASTTADSRLWEALGIVNQISAPFASLLEAAAENPTATANQQLKLVVDIIAFSANSENARAELAARGIIENLASLLVAYSILNKHIDYRGSSRKYVRSPPTALIPDVISAISEIIAGSNFRAQLFILSPDVCEMMSNSLPFHADSRFTFGSRIGFYNPTDGLLPQLHTPTYKSVSFNSGSNAFPALLSLQPTGDRKVDLNAIQQGSDPEHATAVVSWLLFLARSLQGIERLIALKLVALVNNAIEHDAETVVPRNDTTQRSKERESMIRMLAIPLAIQFVKIASEGRHAEPSMDLDKYLDIKEQACEVLALLIRRNDKLQEAAVEAHAVKFVAPALKKTFDSVPIAKPMWPTGSSNTSSQKETPQSCRMGNRDLPPEIQHQMRCRQSALQALAAITEKCDPYRKLMLDAGASSCILDSLKPYPANYFTAQNTNRDKITPKDGNTKGVIIAACDSTRSISRSVSMLRTNLVDAGVAKPIFALLKHQDLEVQIAATNAVCNLLIEFSPMRDDLINAGVIKTLTEHARQSEMGLRLVSLWALKHLVNNAPRDVRVSCMEELGVGWLVGAIQGEHEDTVSAPATGGVSVGLSGGLSTPNAAGEQVDLLNPASMDVDDPSAEGDDIDLDEDEDGEIMYDEASSTHYQASQLRSTLQPALRHHPNSSWNAPAFDSAKYLTTMREMEQNPILLAKRDDVAIQEQGLDFVRNVIGGDECAVMFEHVLGQIGVEKMFSLLNDKLAPIALPASTSAFAQPRSPASRPIYQPSELILSTVHVLVHIANGSPKHKQLLIAQKPLLQNLLPHFNHADRRVRVCCVWVIANLTWIEEESDRADAQKRVRELRGLGIEGAVRGLANDSDLDVRERVKTAVRQMEGL